MNLKTVGILVVGVFVIVGFIGMVFGTLLLLESNHKMQRCSGGTLQQAPADATVCLPTKK